MAAAQAQLEETGRQVARVARRGRRIVLYDWSALVALGLGSLLITLLFDLAPTLDTTTGAGTAVTTVPAWAPIASAAPAIALLAMAVREILVGRRETLGHRPVAPNAPTIFDVGTPSWIGGVREVQEAIARTARSIEWSFVPFALGVISLAVYLASSYLGGGLPGSVGDLLIAPALGLLASVVPLWLTYRAAKQWTRAFQDGVEHQVEDMSLLEAEFLGRFAGARS